MTANNFNPKAGDVVLVCYDGKLARAVSGVVKARRGFALSVEFTQWNRPESITSWFVRTSPDSFGGYTRTDDSTMRVFVGTPGDWYSVIHTDAIKSIGRTVCGCGHIYFDSDSFCSNCYSVERLSRS